MKRYAMSATASLLMRFLVGSVRLQDVRLICLTPCSLYDLFSLQPLGMMVIIPLTFMNGSIIFDVVVLMLYDKLDCFVLFQESLRYLRFCLHLFNTALWAIVLDRSCRSAV